MNKKYGNILFIALIVFSLGCTESKSATAGAQIMDFSFDHTPITDQDTAELTLRIENIGAKTMDGLSKIWIYNVPFGDAAWRLDSINGDTSDKSIIGDGQTIPTTTFFPAGPEMGTPGASIAKILSFFPPAVPLGLSENYDFVTRLCYPYSTTMSAAVTSASATEFRATTDKANLAEGVNSAGPVSIALKSDKLFRAGIRMPLAFVVSNIGGGYTTAREIGSDCSGEVADTAVYLRNHGLFTALVDGSPTDCTGKDIAFDSKGQAVVWCNYEFTGQNPKQEFHVTASVTYNYFISRNAAIAVKGVTSEGITGGGGGGGAVVVATLAKSLCEQAGVAFSDTGKGLPVCAVGSGRSSFPYPGTDINVLGTPVTGSTSGLKSALGTKYSTATIKTLNTHDLKARYFNLASLTLADLDSPDISSQYTRSMLKDSTYWLCRDDNHNDKCDADDPKVDFIRPLGIANYLCAKNAVSGCTETTYRLIFKSDPLKERGTSLTLKNSTQALGSLAINGMDSQSFFNQPIYGLKIVEIGGYPVSDMTAESVKISSINLEDFYIKYIAETKGLLGSDLKGGLDIAGASSLLEFIKCDSQAVTYTVDTRAFCVTAAEDYKGQDVPLPQFSGTSSSQCSTKCTQIQTGLLGACSATDKTKTSATSPYECKGSSVIVYGFNANYAGNTYGCSNYCLCYRTDKALGSAEKLLVCG